MGDRRRTTHSIEVPLTQTPSHNSRKRPPSDTYDDQCKVDEMNECNAALILMNLHNSPHTVSDKWLGSSPGSSSSASWSSGSASPPLSDDGNALHGHIILSPNDAANASANARIRTTSVSTSDEGIVIDFKEERKKKSKKFRCTWKGCVWMEMDQPKIERHVRDIHLRKKARRSGDYDSCSENEHEEEFYYDSIDDDDDELVKTPSPASPPTLSHRDMARPPHEDPEYQRQIVGNFQQGRAMNNYHHQTHQQPQLHHSSSNNNHSNGHGSGHITSTQQQQLQNNNTSCIPTSPPSSHHNYTWASNAAISVSASSTSHQAHHSGSNSATLNKHARPSSSRPSHSTAPYPSPTYVHHHNFSSNNSSSIGSSATSSSNSSSNCSSSNSSPVIHSNSSANNMLQQLSQQNVTVTAHHSAGSAGGHQQQQQQQQHQAQQQHHLSSVTITPNYHPPQPQQQQQTHHHQQQQHLRGQQQPTASNNLVANSGQHMSLQHMAVQQTVSAAKHTPNSPNRRTRGENKKCRKVYGMDRRDQWCTQCKWKKACTRFGD